MAIQQENYDPAIKYGADQNITVDLGDIRDANGNEILEFDAVASAVNYVSLANAATGSNPVLSATGEADLGFTFQNDQGEEILVLDANASAVNHLTIDNAATSSDVTVAAAGDDDNVHLQLSPKGTATVLVGNKGTFAAAQAAGGDLSVTSNTQRGVVTVPDVGILTGSTVVVDLTNDKITSTSIVLTSLGNTTNTTGTPYIVSVDTGEGSAAIDISNSGAVEVNGTVDVNFIVL